MDDYRGVDRVARYREVDEPTFRALVGDDMNRVLGGIGDLDRIIRRHLGREETMHRELAGMISATKAETSRSTNRVLVGLLVVVVAALTDVLVRLVGG